MLRCETCGYRRVKFFHNINKYRYYECKKCHTLFLYPKPTIKDISNYYKKKFKYKAGEINESRIRLKAKIILKNLRKFNSLGNSLLDIGAGYGYFLDEASKNNFNFSGIEPSKKIYNELTNPFIKANIINISFENYFHKFHSKKFDFITLVHTLEHMVNPKEVIRKVLNLLNSNGILYIETPNLDSHLFKSEKYNYTYLTPPDHLWIFSKNSFYSVLQNTPNIKFVKISSYSYPEHLMGIIKSTLLKKPLVENEGKNRKNKNISHNFNIKNKLTVFKNLKYYLFDGLLAPFFTPLLNLGIYGSILELYIRKK